MDAHLNKLSVNRVKHCCRDGSVFKSTYFCREPRLNSQKPHGSLQPTTTPVSEILNSSEYWRHQAYMSTQTCMWAPHSHNETK